MLEDGTQIFVEIVEESADRFLHPARIIEVDEGGYTAELDEDIQLEDEQELFVYFERDREFMQQPARVAPMKPVTEAPTAEEAAAALAEPKVPFSFATTGDPLSAERRQCYRVATIMAELKAEVGDAQCALTDVSVTGFSVLCTQDHFKGEVLEVTLHHAAKDYSGRARVQSIKELPTGQRRYGFSPTETGALQQAQQKISMDMQRAQLRRRSS